MLVVATPLTFGCAHHYGSKATQGALETLRAPPPEGEPRVAERLGHDTTDGALAALTAPEGLDRISAVVDTTVTRSLEALLRAPYGVEGRRVAGPGRSLSLVDRVAHDSALAFGTAFSGELERALGPDGRGPLAESLSATAANVSGSAVQGAQGQLEGLFPGCEGQDRSACLQVQVRSLARAAGAGFMEGIAASSAWSAAVRWSSIALAFIAGIALTLIVGGLPRLRRRAPGAREHSRSG
jgi:hypothetical protein